MPVIHNGVRYASLKFPLLEYIFRKYNPTNDTSKIIIPFTLKDISDAYKHLQWREPSSISNTILDLTRKNNSISSRLPHSIYSLGYDLRKKTGVNPLGGNYAGEFVFVGIGKYLSSWLEWPTTFDRYITVNSLSIPSVVLRFLRKDEGALFSVMDYCDVLSQIFFKTPNSVIRVQHPLKFQPNEIDGFYVSVVAGLTRIYPVEAKALSTGDDINFEQMRGALQMMVLKYNTTPLKICPLAVRMVTNGIQIAVFDPIDSQSTTVSDLVVQEHVFVNFSPAIPNWR